MTKVKTIAQIIGPKIRPLLQEGDIKWLAEECNCSRQTVTSYLEGAYGEDLKVINVIETALEKIITRGQFKVKRAKQLKAEFNSAISLIPLQSRAS